MSRIAYVNGRYVFQKDASINIEDRGYQFSDGVYEVIAVFRGKLVDCEAHLCRLLTSLEALKILLPCHLKVLKIILEKVIQINHIENGTIYLQITRGVATRNHAFPAKNIKPSLIINASQKGPPLDQEIANGVSVITLDENRWNRPDIKSISLLPNVLAKQEAVEQNAFEAWFLDKNGFVTEGSSTNAWIVGNGEEIITRPLGNEILGGITRQTLLKIALKANLKIKERAFSLKEALQAEEAFLTSTTSFVMPVINIDGKTIKNGNPGPVSLHLLNLYRDYVFNEGA